MYKVLIVEDEEIIRKGLIFMLDWPQVNCLVAGEAADGAEGLAKIAAIRPDIVITDVKMPIKNGIQMLEDSIAEYGYEAIIISGYSEFEYAQKAITLNVTDYLLKPVDFGQLYKSLEKLAAKIEAKRRISEYLSALDQFNADRMFIGQPVGKSTGKYVGKMLDYIQDNYSQKISISDFSRQSGRSITYLNVRFKQETGYTFNDFLNRYRVLQAVELLKEDRLKVYEIAEAVGIQDYKYFIQVFKKYTGSSPGKFISN